MDPQGHDGCHWFEYVSMSFLYHNWHRNTSQHDLAYDEYQLRKQYMMNKVRLYITNPENVFNKNTVFHEITLYLGIVYHFINKETILYTILRITTYDAWRSKAHTAT